MVCLVWVPIKQNFSIKYLDYWYNIPIINFRLNFGTLHVLLHPKYFTLFSQLLNLSKIWAPPLEELLEIEDSKKDNMYLRNKWCRVSNILKYMKFWIMKIKNAIKRGSSDVFVLEWKATKYFSWLKWKIKSNISRIFLVKRRFHISLSNYICGLFLDYCYLYILSWKMIWWMHGYAYKHAFGVEEN